MTRWPAAAASSFAALVAASPAHAGDNCRVDPVADAKALEGDALGGEVVRPAAREFCKVSYGLNPGPSVEYFSQVHRTKSGFCKYEGFTSDRSPTGAVFILKPEGECPAQSYRLYTETYDLSDDEFLALDRFWRALVDHGTIDVDTMMARKNTQDPQTRQYLEGTRDDLRRFSPHLEEALPHTDLDRYRLTDAEKTNRFYYLAIEGRQYLIVMATGHGFEVIDFVWVVF